MVAFAVHFDEFRLEVGTHLGEDTTQPPDGIGIEYLTAIFSYEDQMHVHPKNAVSSMSDFA